MNRSVSATPESATDVLLVHTLFKGDYGIGRIVHVEPAGPFANTRAQATAEEFLQTLDWGNIRLLNWIGDVVDAPDPRLGTMTLFDERYAAPRTHVRQLMDLFEQKIRSISEDQKPSIDLDV